MPQWLHSWPLRQGCPVGGASAARAISLSWLAHGLWSKLRSPWLLLAVSTVLQMPTLTWTASAACESILTQALKHGDGCCVLHGVAPFPGYDLVALFFLHDSTLLFYLAHHHNPIKGNDRMNCRWNEKDHQLLCIPCSKLIFAGLLHQMFCLLLQPLAPTIQHLWLFPQARPVG